MKESTSSSTWTPLRRRIVSVLIILHLLAVFAAPWSAPPPAPLLAQRIAAFFRPYTTIAYLNHGYRFFAPDPGPSHVVRYELQMPNGRKRVGMIPDPREYWPRLLYHRHFMLTETLFNVHLRAVDGEAELPDWLSDAERKAYRRERAYAENLRTLLSRGIANQLLNRYDTEQVTLQLLEHQIPFPEDVSRGMKLNAPDLYTQVYSLGTFRRAGQ